MKKNQREKILKAAAGAVNDAFYDLSIHTFKVARQLGPCASNGDDREMKSSVAGRKAQVVRKCGNLFKNVNSPKR